MTIYTCDDHRPLYTQRDDVETADDAARIFANRKAQKIYDKRGFCHHVRKDCWREDGSSINYQAFIGVPWERSGCSGKNIYFTVYVDG